ncbi:MAG: acetylglutamate kinase [Planctomycetes bacterium]|nr:acetylglutamate kinase [Planctomycetota bacterium]
MSVKKVDILMQALPYLRRYRGKTFLVKIGGALADDKKALASMAQDIALLHNVGIKVSVVHGGGPQATQLSARLGLESRFIDGRRITDEGTLEVAKMVFAGKISLDILGALRAEGLKAVGLSGVAGDLIEAKRRAPTNVKNATTGETTVVDMGYVGDIERVDTTLLRVLMDSGFVPVVSPLGADAKGNVLNINADTVATALAIDMKADKFLFMTDVDGVLKNKDDPKTLIGRLTVAETEKLKAKGIISGGMIPKVKACTDAVKGGVGRVHILNGEKPHTILLEIFTKSGVGTLITAE